MRRVGEGFGTVIAILLTLVLFSLVSSFYTKPIIQPDSASYAAFADEIVSGTAFEKGRKPSFERAIRTPLYPLLIAACRNAFGDTPSVILIGHVLVGAVTIVAVSLCLLPWLSAWITGPAILLVLFDATTFLSLDFFPCILTEWLSLNLLLVFFAAMARAGLGKGAGFLFLSSLAASFCALTRPSLIITVPLPFIGWAITGKKGTFLGSFCGLSLGLIPLLAWMAINFNVLGVFATSAFDGVNLFGPASLVGYAQEKEGDPDDLRRFIASVNALKVPQPGSEGEFIRTKLSSLSDPGIEHNTYGVALKSEVALQSSPVRLNEIMRDYGLRAIGSAPGNYLFFVLDNLLRARGNTLILLLVLSLCLYARRMQTLRALAEGGLAVCFIHASNVLLCSMLQHVIWRIPRLQ